MFKYFPKVPVRRVGFFLLAMLGACLAISCSDQRFKSVYPVRGQVFFEGKPAVGAAVTFRRITTEDHPWTKPSAEVDEQGDFKVSTYRAEDGAPPGKYEVTIVWLPKGYNGPLEKGNKLPARYADPATSGLGVELKASDNVLPPFNLTK